MKASWGFCELLCTISLLIATLRLFLSCWEQLFWFFIFWLFHYKIWKEKTDVRSRDAPFPARSVIWFWDSVLAWNWSFQQRKQLTTLWYWLMISITWLQNLMHSLQNFLLTVLMYQGILLDNISNIENG